MIPLPFRAAILLLALVLSSIIFSSQGSATTLHDLRVEAASQDVYESIDATFEILDRLPDQTRQYVNTDIRLLVHAINRSLDRLAEQYPLIVDHAVVNDLHFVADLVRSIAHELRALAPPTSIEINDELATRLDELSAAASARLSQIDTLLDKWIERKRGYYVEADSFAGFTEVVYFNRLTMEIVRYIGIVLFLIGIFIITILHGSRKNSQNIHSSFMSRLASLSRSIFVVYFGACILLAAMPGLLVGLSAEVEVLAQEHPCQRMQAQKHQLGLAQQLDSEILTNLTKQRMQVVAVDCLGVSDAEAADAVELLAAKVAPTLLARSSIPAQELASKVAIAAEPAPSGVQSAAALPDRSASNALDNLDAATVAAEPTAQPGTTSDLPAAKPDVQRLQAKNPTPTEAEHETAREAALAVSAARSLTDQGTSRPRGIPRQSTRFESQIETALSSPAELPEERNDLKLYLHFSGPNDRELVEELGKVLGEAGYEIAGIDRVGGKIITGDIRYRHQDQEEDVENIRTISENYLKKNTTRHRISLKSVDIGRRYPNQPKNRIELWLPKLGSVDN